MEHKEARKKEFNHVRAVRLHPRLETLPSHTLSRPHLAVHNGTGLHLGVEGVGVQC